MKLFVATPMYGGNCSGEYTANLVMLADFLRSNNIAWEFRFIFNESLITRARNNLTKQFLDSDCTHLLFIDSDIAFNPMDVISLVNQDKQIICGAYPSKEINWNYVKEASVQGKDANELVNYSGRFVLNLLENKQELETEANKPFEVLNSGTGFMLIKREVFQSIKVPSYKIYGVEYKEFFTTSIVNEELLSEDYNFCKLARDAGYKIYVAPWVKLSHIGTYKFSGSLTN